MKNWIGYIVLLVLWLGPGFFFAQVMSGLCHEPMSWEVQIKIATGWPLWLLHIAIESIIGI